MTFLERSIDQLNSLPDYLIYILLGLSAFVENVFPPVPGDTITAFGAFLVGADRLSFLGVYISTSIGSLAGFMFLFWIGMLLGRKFFIERDLWIFKAQDIIRAEEWYQKYGYYLILLNRFLPGIRSVISISGGISGMKTLTVAFLAFISSCAWNLVWIYFGYTLGNNWEAVKGKISDIMIYYNFIVLAVIGIVLLVFVLQRIAKRKK